MEKNLCKYIPQWVSSSLKNRFCPKCGQKIAKNDVIAVGMRQASNNMNMFVEHKCSKCGYREITNIGNKKTISLEELCYALLDSIQKQKDIEKSKSIETKNTKIVSHISDDEVNELLDFIQNSTSHEDFMKFIRADKEGLPNEHPDES